MDGLRSSLSFFTVFPVRSPELRGKMVYFLSIIGMILGGISGLLYFLGATFLNSFVGSSLAVISVLILSGFNHLDGVLDSGDAIMARTTTSVKLKILKDHNVGAGAIGVAFSLYLLMVAFLSYLPPVSGAIAVILAEIMSKLSFIVFFKSARIIETSRLGRFFEKSISERWGGSLIWNFSAISLIFLILPGVAFPALLITLIVTYISRRRMYLSFGGVNGDLAALNGEMVRLSVIIFISLYCALGSGLPLYL